MKNVPFDVYSNIPEGLKTYLATNGMNFSKKLYEFAVSMMKGRQPVTPLSKEEVYALMKKYNLTLENDNACYIFAMAKSDYLGSSLANEQVLCKFVQDYLGDAMDKLKCGSKSYDIAYDNLSSCSVNTGLTFSDYISRTSVIVISITNSEKEFLKSYHHELGHCAVHICQFYGIPLEGEEVQYLGQDLVDRTWDIAKIFLCDCDCCKNKRNEKKRDFEGNESHEK